MAQTRSRHRLGWLKLAILALAFLAAPVRAIYESQAGVFDWHQEWIGKVFWSSASRGSQIIVATEKNVLAALNEANGAIAWRQLFDGSIDNVKAVHGGVITISNQGENLQFWDHFSGKLVWERHLTDGPATVAISENGDTVVLAGKKLTKFTAKGQQEWSVPSPESVSTLRIQGDQLYLIGPSNNNRAFTIHSLNPATGEKLQSTQIKTDVAVDRTIVVGKHLIWVDNGSFKWNELGSKKVLSATIPSVLGLLPSFDSIVPNTVGVQVASSDIAVNHFIITADIVKEGIASTASAVFRVAHDSRTLEIVQELTVQDTARPFDGSQTQITRFGSTLNGYLAIDVVAQDEEGKAAVTTTRIPHRLDQTGHVVYGRVLAQKPFLAVVVTESGSLLMVNGDGIVWSREEALGHVAAAEFLDLPEEKLWTQMADELDENVQEQLVVTPLTRYTRRLLTHTKELTQLPKWVLSRFLGHDSVQTKRDAHQRLASQACWVNGSDTPQALYKDNFGLRKLLLTVTETGKVIAQDSANGGTIVWSRYFDHVVFEQIHVVRAASVKLPPLLVAIGQSNVDGYPVTHFYRLNALTGQDFVTQVPEAQEYFEPELLTETTLSKVIRLPIEEPDERTHILALFEAGSGRVYIYPDTEGSRKEFRAFMPNFYFVHKGKNGAFKGYNVAEGFRGSLNAVPVWTLDIPPSETTVAIGKHPAYEKVALLGRALGNRNVLYKYLNPSMFTILTADSERNVLVVRLVDSVKGTILYETVHHNVDTVHHTAHVVQAENWVVYHFWSNDRYAKGYQAVILELYEGEHENERILKANFSSFDEHLPYVRSASFMFPYPVDAMAVTTTRNGISTREILFALPTHQILGVNKRLLDPRRPHDSPNKEEQEEGLIPYGPIPEERQMFLSYNREVIGIKHIVTTSAGLESTSLLFAYGLDTFFTRSSPSKRFDVLSEDFSKSQLLLTIVGLIAGIVAAGPMVRRKQLNALWR